MPIKERRKIYAPLSTEYLLSTIFGSQTYHGFVGEHNLASWKKHVIKLTNVIAKFVNINVTNADPGHKSAMLEENHFYLKQIKTAKAIDQINISLIEYLCKTLFLLLGMLPDNFFRKVVNHKEHYRLNRRRQIVYVQNFEQKFQAILDLTNDSRFSPDLPQREELFRAYRTEFKGDHEAFIDWFKYEYTDIYLRVF